MRSGMLRRFTAGAVVSGLVLAGVLMTSASPAAQTRGADETSMSVRRALERLPYYGVFDYMAFGVDRGTVTLMGYAYHGTLRSAAETAVKRTSGVDEVANQLEILPVNQNDDRIRWETFYRIYTDTALSRYAPGGGHFVVRDLIQSSRFPGMQPLGSYPIHIIVKNGRTTLLGAVGSRMDRQIAETRAREVSGAFSVENELTISTK